jgi:hypothetical protein
VSVLCVSFACPNRPGSRGPANLAMATIAAEGNRTDEAIKYYGRDIAASCPDRPVQNRGQSRLQLVQLLAKSAKQAQPRAELLLLSWICPRILPCRSRNRWISDLLRSRQEPLNRVAVTDCLRNSGYCASSACASLCRIGGVRPKPLCADTSLGRVRHL